MLIKYDNGITFNISRLIVGLIQRFTLGRKVALYEHFALTNSTYEQHLWNVPQVNYVESYVRVPFHKSLRSLELEKNVP